MNYKVSIIIPVFNNIMSTLRCLDSLYHVNHKELEIVVVDDGSTDDTGKIIKEYYPDTVVLRFNGDLWWSGGVNEGIKYALSGGSEYIILLNNDNIVEENFVKELLEKAELYPNSIICSKVLLMNESDKIFFAGGYENIFKGGLLMYGYNQKNSDNFSHMKEVQWCGGMGVLIPKNILEDVGLFNKKSFPQYYGDADFMYRARKKGYKVIFNPSSIVWNDIETTGVSLSRKISMDEVKSVLFSIKSIYNLTVNFKFYFWHFNIFKAIVTLVTRYLILSGSIIKRMLPSKSL